MTKKQPSSKKNKNQASKGNKSKILKGQSLPSRNEPSGYPWQVRFLFFFPILAGVIFLSYIGLQADDKQAFEFLSSFLEQFITSPIKIRGEALNIIFGLAVFLVWSGGQAFEGLFSVLDKFISWVAGTDIRGTKDAKSGPANVLYIVLAFLGYGLLSILTVGVSY